MLSKAKPALQPTINLIAKPFMRIHPNVLTLMGLVPPMLFFWLMLNGEYTWALVSFIGVAFDFIDGAVARSTGRVSAFGGLLDSSIDRVADGLYITAFGFVGLVRWELVLTLLILSYLISYIRSRAELAGKAKFILNVGIMERSERLAGLAVALLIFIVEATNSGNIELFNSSDPVRNGIYHTQTEIVFIILALLSLITVVQRFAAAKERLGKLEI